MQRMQNLYERFTNETLKNDKENRGKQEHEQTNEATSQKILRKCIQINLKTF